MNKYFQINFGDLLDWTSRPTFGSQPTVWETLQYREIVAVSCWKSNPSAALDFSSFLFKVTT